MKIAYKAWRPQAEAQALVTHANSIIAEYQAAGYTLTLRQLYYQFVARAVIPNSEKSYKNLGNIVTRARMAGMISWQAIEDRGRACKSPWTEEDLLTPVENLPHYIRFDQWARQDTYLECWVEKEALGNVVERACSPLLVPWLSCKGYLSASEAWRSGMRFAQKMQEGKACVLIHLGDHDPSGIDMTRDNQERMDVFTRIPYGVEVKRVALNMDQVEKYGPPPNPAKMTDTRAHAYIAEYGSESWELDALEPQVLEDLIAGEALKYIDSEVWSDVQEEQEAAREVLRKVGDNWGAVQALVENL